VTTILVIDNDLGFMAYFCMTLTEAGYTAVPVLTAERAIPLLQEMGLSHVDLLIVNLELPEVVGFVESMRSRHVKVIAIENPGISRIKPIPVDAVLRRPLPYAQTEESVWLRMVRRVLGEAA
jgi:DNA-binding NtrC family response regulator